MNQLIKISTKRIFLLYLKNNGAEKRFFDEHRTKGFGETLSDFGFGLCADYCNNPCLNEKVLCKDFSPKSLKKGQLNEIMNWPFQIVNTADQTISGTV